MFNRKPSDNSQPTGLIRISGSNEPGRRGDVIFVHGLAGHPQNTWHWQNPKDEDYQKDKFWLTWWGEDLKDVGIWTFGYSAARLRANGSAMPLFDQASNFLDDLENFGIGERPIVFVTHSMGGLLVKKMLNVVESFLEVESKKAVFQSTKGIVFLSTPHLGSDVAKWTQAFASFFTVNVRELIADDDELRRLDEWYRQKFDTSRVKTKVYYETEPTKGIEIVNKSSANPCIRNVQPIAVEADHDSIAKPKTEKDKVYLGVKKFIQECLPAQKSLPPADNSGLLIQPIEEKTINMDP
jgi:predicted alpha/beta hydrolase family esterase